jgi:hypothetical protein
MTTLWALAACALLGACASPEPPAQGAAHPSSASARCRDEPVIGSNIPKPCGGAATR